MSRVQLRTAGIALVALLAFPRAGNAGFSIIDFIWEMSGPQMIGVVFNCEYDLRNETTECTAAGKRVVGTGRSEIPRVWLTLAAGAYTSTGKDSGAQQYDAFENYMLAFEPVLEVRSTPGGDFSVHHGLIGLSYNFLFGTRFKAFNKAGLKFVPIGFRYKGFNFAYNLRVYPDGFTPEEFDSGPPLPGESGRRETVHGFSVGFLW